MSDRVNPHPEDETDEDVWQDWIDDAYERTDDQKNYFFRYWEDY